jgi:hypothetical protein
MTQPVYFSNKQSGVNLEYNPPTYGTMKKSQLEAFDIYHREKLEAALATLSRILQQDEIDELRFRIDEECEKQERRLANLRQASRAMEEIRAANGHILEQDFSQLQKAVYKTPYGVVMAGIQNLLEEFWTA